MQRQVSWSLSLFQYSRLKKCVDLVNLRKADSNQTQGVLTVQKNPSAKNTDDKTHQMILMFIESYQSILVKSNYFVESFEDVDNRFKMLVESMQETVNALKKCQGIK